jgi:hypothetical protein
MVEVMGLLKCVLRNEGGTVFLFICLRVGWRALANMMTKVVFHKSQGISSVF